MGQALLFSFAVQKNWRCFLLNPAVCGRARVRFLNKRYIILFFNKKYFIFSPAVIKQQQLFVFSSPVYISLASVHGCKAVNPKHEHSHFSFAKASFVAARPGGKAEVCRAAAPPYHTAKPNKKRPCLCKSTGRGAFDFRNMKARSNESQSPLQAQQLGPAFRLEARAHSLFRCQDGALYQHAIGGKQSKKFFIGQSWQLIF